MPAWLGVAMRTIGTALVRIGRHEGRELDYRTIDPYGPHRMLPARRDGVGAPRPYHSMPVSPWITLGLGWRYRDYARAQAVQKLGQYGSAGREAHAVGAGLWDDKHAMAPWSAASFGTS